MSMEEEIEKFMNGFGKSFERLKHTMEDCRCKCAKMQEQDDENAEIIKDLKDDYNTCMEWAFGKEAPSMTQDEALKKWIKRHPSLPVPRVLQLDLEPPYHISTALLLFDILPHWLEHLEDKSEEE